MDEVKDYTDLLNFHFKDVESLHLAMIVGPYFEIWAYSKRTLENGYVSGEFTQQKISPAVGERVFRNFKLCKDKNFRYITKNDTDIEKCFGAAFGADPVTVSDVSIDAQGERVELCRTLPCWQRMHEVMSELDAFGSHWINVAIDQHSWYLARANPLAATDATAPKYDRTLVFCRVWNDSDPIDFGSLDISCMPYKDEEKIQCAAKSEAIKAALQKQ